MLAFGAIYCTTMLVRLVLGLTIFRSNRWFSSILPTTFHLVLASYLLLDGHFHFRYGATARNSRAATPPPQS